jgi:signal transduction histidine kinase
MRLIGFRSLQVRLAVRLALLYFIATATAVAVLLFEAYNTAENLNDRDLNLRAADLARYVSAETADAIRLELPPRLAAAYRSGSTTDMFAVRLSSGRAISAYPPDFGAIVAKWPIVTGDDASYFRLRDFGSELKDYYGLSISLDSAAGQLVVTVARATEVDALAKALLRDFVVDVAWVSPVLVLVTSAVGIFVVRQGLKPIRTVSETVAMIGPESTSIRLSDEGLPTEITPLVAAVNRALDRLDHGFSIQRKFTANAAHELRTPLAIITAALDTMEGNGDLKTLKGDVARMNRLIEQLLRVARLDAVALDVSGAVDLRDIAADIVAAMVPWALAQQRTIALDSPEHPVYVRGNQHAIGDAIRNLIENAVTHTPPRTEVGVKVQPAGTVSVLDHGPGISLQDRTMIFERFWRGKNAASGGAGLGLTIVREIMNAHNGSISVDAGPDGGANLTLCFPPVNSTAGTVDAA